MSEKVKGNWKVGTMVTAAGAVVVLMMTTTSRLYALICVVKYIDKRVIEKREANQSIWTDS